jgi:hypothetical protein
MALTYYTHHQLMITDNNIQDYDASNALGLLVQENQICEHYRYLYKYNH